MRAASINALTQIKDVTEEDARRIRAVWKATNLNSLLRECPVDFNVMDTALGVRNLIVVKRKVIDRLLQTCGVEYLGWDKRSRDSVYYCNAGDSYATTVIFRGDNLIVGCWGDLVEQGRVVECSKY